MREILISAIILLAFPNFFRYILFLSIRRRKRRFYNECETKAKQGDPEAQYNLGMMYTDGRGVLQDDKEALKWYHKAAKQGLAHAQYHLGLMHVNGYSVSQDYVMAHMFFDLAASNGNLFARDERDALVEEMNDSEIEQAQDLVGEWVSKHKSQGDNEH